MAVSLRLPLVVADDVDFLRVSDENPGYRFEREEDGTLTVSPTSSDSGAQSAQAIFQLVGYAKRVGGRAFDSSTGFRIGRAVKSPDAAWISKPRIDRLSASERTVFWSVSPDVAIEIKSPSDDFRDTLTTIEFYVKHGSAYAVAIDPATREVVQLGTAPIDLALDFDAIIDA